jgi:hypothetical protein
LEDQAAHRIVGSLAQPGRPHWRPERSTKRYPTIELLKDPHLKEATTI